MRPKVLASYKSDIFLITFFWQVFIFFVIKNGRAFGTGIFRSVKINGHVEGIGGVCHGDIAFALRIGKHSFNALGNEFYTARFL